MECVYCKEWIISPIIQKEKKKVKKFCKEKKLEITSDSIGCASFQISKFFYCDNDNSRMQTRQCIERQIIAKDKENKKGKYYKQCKKCSQGEDIKYIYKKHNPYIVKLKRRNKTIKIKRRRKCKS